MAWGASRTWEGAEPLYCYSCSSYCYYYYVCDYDYFYFYDYDYEYAYGHYTCMSSMVESIWRLSSAEPAT